MLCLGLDAEGAGVGAQGGVLDEEVIWEYKSVILDCLVVVHTVFFDLDFELLEQLRSLWETFLSERAIVDIDCAVLGMKLLKIVELFFEHGYLVLKV